MTTGRCSGSVKMVMQFYDLMVLGGVPSTFAQNLSSKSSILFGILCSLSVAFCLFKKVFQKNC